MPSDRLTRFRQYMAAFEGAADPAKSIEHGHYVRAPGQMLVDQIAGRIALRPNSTHLLVGGIGSGKTTQLLVAKQQLEAVGDLAVCYVDVSRYTDISQIEPGVLMTIVGLELQQLLDEKSSAQIQLAVKSLKEIAYGHTTTQEIPAFDSQALLKTIDNLTTAATMIRKKTITHKGLLVSHNSSNKPTANPKLEKAFHAILNAVNQQLGKGIVILLDGLDRIDEIQKFSRIIQSDVQTMKQSGMGAVIVGPMLFIHSAHQDAKDLIDNLYYQPCFDVEQSEEAKTFLASVLRKRLGDRSFLKVTAMHRLVKNSGGILRDLITLTQSSIEEAYISGQEYIRTDDVEKATRSLAATKLLGISEKGLEILRNHLQDGNFVLGSPESIELLMSRTIIEYNYPNMRYVVHPAIVPLLQPVAA
jgi:hypothetical protein